MKYQQPQNKRKQMIVKNTTMLLLLNIAKLVFPFITLPYLTRILSTESYGVVAYVKAVMSYMQVIVDFGFMLSATKQIVEAKSDKDKIGKIVSQNILAKAILTIGTAGILAVLICSIPLLKHNIVYTLLSYMTVALTIFLPDFLFRGIEQMHVITIRFVIMKGIATLCTFLFVRSDADILLIPCFDIVGSIAAIIWVGVEVKKMGIRLQHASFIDSLAQIKASAIYFMSNVATTSFNVFNTIIIGIALPTTEIAYWSVCMQIINAIQALYIPISDAIYPEMVRSKDITVVKKAVRLVGPIVLIGAIIIFWQAKLCLFIIGGDKYTDAYVAFRILTLVVLFGFFGVIYGWPTLGSIGKEKETTKSTVTAVIFQIVTVLLLLQSNHFSLINIAIVRSITEIIMFSIRYYYYCKYKSLFKNTDTSEI